MCLGSHLGMLFIEVVTGGDLFGNSSFGMLVARDLPCFLIPSIFSSRDMNAMYLGLVVTSALLVVTRSY